MKFITRSIVCSLSLIAAAGNAIAQTPECGASDPGFQSFLPRFEQGINNFLNGDPTLWKQNVSKRDDTMIMGAWGAYEKGWKEVDARYDWAAARFKPNGAKVAIEYLSCAVNADLAYIVAIERSEVHLVDQVKASPMALRSNHIFRKEDGDWKLVLRHADPLMSKSAPGAVLHK